MNNKTVKIGIFIPGRLSSERLPNKLILPLNDKGDTLWDIACKKLNSLPYDYVKVALCQDKELIDVANKYCNLKVIERDYNTTIAEGPMSYIFKDLKDVEDVTHWMFLNPCLALLSKNAIRDVLEQFEKTPCNFATSVKRYNNWLFDMEGNCISGIDYDTLSTKEVKGKFEAAHAFHIFSKDFLFTEDKNTLMKDEKTSLFIIPSNQLLDVDTKEDYEYLKFFISNRVTHNRFKRVSLR